MSIFDKVVAVGVIGTYLTSLSVVIYIVLFMGKPPKGR